MSPVRRPRAPRPTVVIVQREPWVSFLQLAAALRRHRVRVVHVGNTDSRDSRIMGRLLFSRSETLASFLREGFTEPTIVDIQGSEYDLTDLTPLLADARTPTPLAEAIRHRLLSLDKFEMSRRLRAAGVAVPDTLDATLVDIPEAVRTLGLPLVVKSRVGAGGQGVHVATKEAEVAELLASHRPEDLFYERYCPGETLQFAAVHDGATILQQAVYRSVRRGQHLGPAQAIETVAEPEIGRLGAATAAAVGGRGLLNIDVQLGADGPQVVDVNLRAWDSLVALRAAGVDFASGYLHALGLPKQVRGRPVARPGRVIWPFPGTVLATPPARDGLATATRFVRRGWRYALWLGPRYVLHAAWLVAVELRSRQRTRAARASARPRRSPRRPDRDAGRR